MRIIICAGAVLVVTASAAAQPLPSAPSRLEARVTSAGASFTWDAAPGTVDTYRLEAGSSPGSANLATISIPGARTSTLSLSAPPGTYFVRVRALNSAGPGPASNEVVVVVGACPAPPVPSASVTAGVTGTIVAVNWAPSPLATSYVLEAGSAIGLSDVFNADVGGTTAVSAAVAPGVYAIRVRARNACGASSPSPEARVLVPAGAVPGNLSAAAVGSTVSLAWAAPDGGADSYLLDVGTSSGSINLGSIPLAGPGTSASVVGVPPGTYFVRARGVRSGVVSAPSNEANVTVSTAVPASATIGFGGFTVNPTPLTSYSESGMIVVPIIGAWEGRTTYGNPAPYVGFTRNATSDSTATLSVGAGGRPFRLSSLDLYSSITAIPVVLTGLLGSNVVFSYTTTLPNTFGNFARLGNARADAVIDTLVVTMMSDFAPNPMGIDNIVVLR